MTMFESWSSSRWNHCVDYDGDDAANSDYDDIRLRV